MSAALLPPPGSDSTSTLDRFRGALATFIREQFPFLTFAGAYEYVVVSQAGQTLSLAATDPTLGLPALGGKVPIRMAAGIQPTLPPGSKCIVQFVNGRPSRPIVIAADEQVTPTKVQVNAIAVELGAVVTGYVALAAKVDANFTTLFNNLTSWTPVSNDGGAALKAVLTNPLLGGYLATGVKQLTAAATVKAQ